MINNDDIKILLWSILHETPSIYFNNFMLFFNIEKLLEELINKIIRFYNSLIYKLICACIVYFMFEFLELNMIQKISITVVGSTTTILLNKEKLLIEFEYNVKTKELKLRSISDSNLLKGIYQLQSKGISLIHNPYCFESYLLSPNTIQACDILSGCAFFNDVFLPKMRERVSKNRVIMRVDKKFSKLSDVNFQTKQTELGMTTNSFEKYQERYDTPLFTYIYEDKDQFENWSAIRIFEWWRNLRMSGTQLSTITQKIPKQEWPVFDSVKYLFINQILHILNSYRKYGITDESHQAYMELHKYSERIDVFYRSRGQYRYLLDAHLAYCRWFNVRFIRGLLFETGIKNNYSNTSTYVLSKNDNVIKSIRELFNYTLEDANSILFAPSSYFQKESKFINTYSAPLIVFLGVNYRTHIDSPNFKSVYSPEGQLFHDISLHYSRMIIKSNYNKIKINTYNDVKLFAKRCKFLMIISLINDYNVSILLWYILHDRSKSYFCIIFFICQYLLLNEIKQVRINIIEGSLNNTIQIFYNEEMIIEFQINIDSKEINITDMIPNINRRYIEGLNDIKKYFIISIDNQTQLKMNNYKQTTKLIKNMINKKYKNYLSQLQ